MKLTNGFNIISVKHPLNFDERNGNDVKKLKSCSRL